MVRIATFNVENLFSRPKAFEKAEMDQDNDVLDAYNKVNGLIKEKVYTTEIKQKIMDLLVQLDIYFIHGETGAVRKRFSSDPKWAWLRKNKGTFDKQPRDNSRSVEIIAEGHEDWFGWVDLAREIVDEKSILNTARAIREIDPDILCIVEAEDRPSLLKFNEDILDGAYDHIMLVDGNDERGIDVGIMTKEGFTINSIVSNVDLEDEIGEVFSRDCPQYEVTTPDDDVLHILVNHFKSQSGGGGPKRRRQSVAVRKIVDRLLEQGEKVVVLGDLNEGPQEEGRIVENFSALFEDDGPLLDCYALEGFDLGIRPGTFNSCSIRNRLDYILISKNIRANFEAGAIFRKGLFGKRKTPPDWEVYPEITKTIEQASDHALVWIDLKDV